MQRTVLERKNWCQENIILTYLHLEIQKCRKLLADIQVEEQNHAEMLYKYKMVNGMK